MLKLTATSDDRVDPRTVLKRQTHHLTRGWTPNQSWKIKGLINDREVEGDAQIVVLQRDEDCAAVVRMEDLVDVVLCRGMVHALERLGVDRKKIEVT